MQFASGGVVSIQPVDGSGIMSRLEVCAHVFAWAIFAAYLTVGFTVFGVVGPLWFSLLGIPVSLLWVASWVGVALRYH